MHEAEQSARDARQQPAPPSQAPAGKGEIIAWASYDVANSTYATVVATAVYNAYFVKVIAGSAGLSHAAGTFLLTIMIAVSAFLVVLTAPILGTIADATAGKKQLLFASTACCIIATFMLSWVNPGQYVAGMILLIIANFAFGTGENFIASFLPELTTKDKMGRISAIGWGAGYIGGLFSLSAALAYVSWAQKHSVPETEYVPQIAAAVALLFGVLALPTFVWLKERATADTSIRAGDYLQVAIARLKVTFTHSLYYRDLFNILLAICMYSCGTGTVVHLASVYAAEVLHFSPKELLGMILVVDITAAIGAFAFGYIQDKIGSVRTLTIALSIWTIAVLLASIAQEKWHLWLAGNFIGVAMGSAGSAGRALVGRFSPHGRSGEFLGLWGLSMKAATAIGVLSFGGITYITHDLRLALLCMTVFFVVGILLVLRVDEERGIAAAEHEVPQ
jgi:UMF1 family MFS transporter